MSGIRGLAGLVFVAALLPPAAGARAADEVLAPGEVPLTRTMVEDYARYAARCRPEALARAGGAAGLARLLVHDWANGDRAAQRVVLVELRWWREEFPRLGPAAPGSGPGGNPAADLRAVQAAWLRQRHEARQADLRALSDLQASHHATMMMLIENLRPSGRYEYNPSSGRYDRYVPEPSRR